MPERRRARWRIAGFLGFAATITAAIIGVKYGMRSTGREAPAATTTAMMIEGIKNGDAKMLPLLLQRMASSAGQLATGLGEAEAAECLETLTALRTGFPSFAGPARSVAVSIACLVLDRFGTEPAPSQWVQALVPVHDLLSASLASNDPELRIKACNEMARFWVWLPGCSLTPMEERELAAWKEALFSPVVRCLARTDPGTRVAAVACLGKLPLDDRALAAIPYLEDASSVDVRTQTLVSFAKRSTILTDDLLLKRLNDDDLGVRHTAELILKTRGFTTEQVSMGALIFSPKPDQRISIIPMLKNRNDLDPVVWLVQLSHDPVEMVRMSAIEALAGHRTPVVKRRLTEMAHSDKSEAVRAAASKLIPRAQETTASLPPLPGSPSLNPKAN
jgi:hypothetical protein